MYTILARQLGLTTLLAILYKSNAQIQSWAQSNGWILLLSALGAIISLIVLIVYRKSHPTNMYLLALFTVLEAHGVATVVTFYDTKIVLQATLITFAIFVGLSLYTFQTKYDFAQWQPFLFGSLWVTISFI